MSKDGKLIVSAIAILFIVGMSPPVLAGDLTPPGVPGSTMHTLEEIYNIVQNTNSNVESVLNDQALVPQSGQTTSYAIGDDGDLQAGLAWAEPRFTDNGDGTVTDNLTGLIWLKAADCFGAQTWANALVAANTLNSDECGLSDGSVEGDWRLPQVKELQSLIDFGNFNPTLPTGHPFSGVQSGAFSYYWSAGITAYDAGRAWTVGLCYGNVGSYYKSGVDYVWPVRGGN